MIICPVCEHQQQLGLECEVCGKELGNLAALGAPPIAPERLAGLEPTVPKSVGEVPVERLGDLEQTRLEVGAAAAPVGPVPDVERTQLAAVGEVPLDRVPDLTADRAPDDGARTAVPAGPIACRYCAHVQAGGLLCERCGMKLPRASAAPVEATRTRPREPVTVRCSACGAPTHAGERCRECGREVPPADA